MELDLIKICKELIRDELGDRVKFTHDRCKIAHLGIIHVYFNRKRYFQFRNLWYWEDKKQEQFKIKFAWCYPQSGGGAKFSEIIDFREPTSIKRVKEIIQEAITYPPTNDSF